MSGEKKAESGEQRARAKEKSRDEGREPKGVIDLGIAFRSFSLVSRLSFLDFLALRTPLSALCSLLSALCSPLLTALAANREFRDTSPRFSRQRTGACIVAGSCSSPD